MQTKVLLVEDNPVEARLIQEFIKDFDNSGYDLNHVQTMEACLNELAVKEFDLLILDLTLPDSRGVESFTNLRSKFRDLPIIISTNMEDSFIAENLIGAGAKDYLFKSKCDSKTLEKAFNKAIKRAEVKKQIEQATVQSVLHDYPEVALELRHEYQKVLRELVSEADARAMMFGIFDKHSEGILILGVNHADFDAIHQKVVTEVDFIQDNIKQAFLAEAHRLLDKLYL